MKTTPPEAAPPESSQPVAASPLASDVRAPLATARPGGEDVTYDDRFQHLKAQIDALSTVSGHIDQEKALAEDAASFVSHASPVDYAALVETGRALLRERSKDLRVLCYVVLGRYHTDGLPGLADGLQALEAFVDAFWEDGFPPKRRVHARSGALTFLMQRLGDALDAAAPAPADRPALETALAALDRLQAFLMEALGEHAPVCSGLKTRLRDALRRLPAPEPEPESLPETTPEADPAPKPVAVSTAPPRPTTGPPPAALSKQRAPTIPASDRASESASEPLSPTEAERLILRAAAALRDEAPSDPTAYRLTRVICWESLRQTPPHEAKKTRIPPPRPHRCTYLRSLLEDGEHATLVREAEDSFQQPPFHLWLDAQRLLAVATEALGDAYAPLHEVLLAETTRLVRRLPELAGLAFSDGTPFADPDTRAWLTSLLPSAPPTPAPASTGPEDAPTPRDESQDDASLKTARRHLAAGDLPAALQAMEAGRTGDASGHGRFLHRLHVATLCLQAGQPALARPLLEALDAEVAHHHLDVWSPALALETWIALYGCYGALSGHAADPEPLRLQASALFEKVCRLDVRRALTLQGAAVSTR